MAMVIYLEHVYHPAAVNLENTRFNQICKKWTETKTETFFSYGLLILGSKQIRAFALNFVIVYSKEITSTKVLIKYFWQYSNIATC